MRAGPRSLSSLLATVAVIALSVACGGDSNYGSPATDTPAATTTQPALETTATAELTPPDATGSLQLTSSDFADNGEIPTNYTCDGDNISPPLSIAGVPADTASLALTATDIDGPGGDFVHWTIWNIDPTITEVPAATVPQGGVEGQTGRGAPGYFGPCPPAGEHRYVFELYALDEVLALAPATSGKAELLAAMQGHVLSQAELTGIYQR